MGGKITVESELGKGSTFSFTARLGVLDEEEKPVSRCTDLASTRMLIVDDNETNRLILKEMLGSQGAHIGEASSGREALAEVERARAAGEPYELIVLDCRMPEMDGFEVAHRLTNQPVDVQPRILMLTSDYLNPKLMRLSETGIDAYVVKPVRRSELLHAIESLTGKAHPQDETAQRAPDDGASANKVRRLNILLAEDSPDNRFLVEAYLKGLPYRLDIAENGEIAVYKFMRGKYDMVLMDVQMPIMDGHTATRKIRDWEKEHHAAPTPVVALTASALSEDIRNSLEAGCTAHLSKPIKKARLLTAIRDLAKPAESIDGNGNKERIVVEIDPDIKELIPDFLEHKRDDLSSLTDALERVDFEMLRSIGHKIKGEGAGFGFQAITEIGDALENAGLARDLKTAEQQVWALSRFLDHVEVRYPEQPAEDSPPDSPSGDQA
jgi:CheY-like chemotaxis protein/HPt (histidine-containing phosphotransfer) domain-containing protein